MKRATTFLLLAAFVLLSLPATAQQTNNFKDQFNRHFQYASQRLIQLAEEMPAEYYSWSPDGEAFTFERVCMHIARYNYLYPQSSLGIPAPEDIDLDGMEEFTGKETVVDYLRRSVDHVETMMEQMPESRLTEDTRLYGRTVNGQAVLMQLITHMSEHVGQAISYARMNEIVPPWNQ